MSPSGAREPRSRPSGLKVSLLLVTAICLLVLFALLVPRYRRSIATVDDAHRWSAGSAPPRREIVWQPATEVEIEADSVETVSHIRPQLAGDGEFLYFTIRKGENDLDIVRSQRTASGWSQPQQVDELNSPYDDIGPVISDDGDTLYLYSDRTGGVGGMDLYVARRDGESWTAPENLGAAINSPAHEYDPAITPDGRRLFFASNRDQQTYDPDRDHWTTTLRSDPGKRTFDLFAAEFDPPEDQWRPAQPLKSLNTSRNNEGSPYVSSDGAFLYFSSDRPLLRGERKNFDIYRARLGGEPPRAENLGIGINTPAHEIEPATSAAGFRLHFSRSDRETGTRYALFESTAKEVYRDAEWDDSNFWSFGTMLANGVKQIVDRFWLILLMLAALASLYWLIRQIRFRHVAVPGFLMLALLLHLCFVAGSFFVFFQQSIAKRLQELLEQDVVATEVLNSTVAKTTEQSTLQTVADLKMPDPIEPAKVSRQAIEYSEPQPIELAKPQPITKSAALSAEIVHDPVVATILVPSESPERREPLRRATERPQRRSEQIDLMRTVAVQTPKTEPVDLEPIEIERQKIDQAVEIIEPVAMEPAPTEPTLTTTDPSQLQPAERADANVEVSPAEVVLQRDSIEPQRDPLHADTPLPSEQVAAVESEAISPPSAQESELPRTEEMLVPTLAQPKPLKLRRDSGSVLSPPGVESLVPLVARADVGGTTETESATSPLKRTAAFSRRAADIAADVSTESIELIARQAEPFISPVGATKVDLSRQTPAAEAIDIEAVTVKPRSDSAEDAMDAGQALTPLPLLSRANVSRDPLAAGTLAQRTPARSRLYADASVRLQNLLMRRKLDEATKIDVIKEFGGNDETLAAIRRGLSWIEQHQHRDGRWSLNEFHKNCDGHKQCNGRGGSRSDTAGTGLALLPFLGDGNTHQEGPYRDVVASAVTWLVKNQKPDGDLFTGGEGNAHMYSHGIATIALCECYGMTGDQSLRDPAQRAIDFIVAAQDPKSGGWRYQPRNDADTSVVGWQVMALKSGQMAELNVPGKTLQGAQRWLDSVAGQKNKLGQFAYQRNNKFNPAMTAEAILCLEYLDNERESEPLIQGTDYLLKNLPKKNRETSYYWYYGTQSMFHLQGEPWRRWNESIHPLLVETQRKEGPMIGTWDPTDQWEKSGGRIYATSLRILMLEVYYRHLPLYQVIE